MNIGHTDTKYFSTTVYFAGKQYKHKGRRHHTRAVTTLEALRRLAKHKSKH